MIERWLAPQNEPFREESPEYFLNLFSEISGMNRVGAEDFEDTRIKSREALLGRVVGGVVFGSCANPESKPKDLDMFLVLNQDINPRAWEYSQELKLRFDEAVSQKRGRFYTGVLDIPGFIPWNGELIVEKPIAQALQEAHSPIVYAYNISEIEPFIQSLQEMRSTSRTR